jgi:tungstate transport system ATP-binding protein
MVREGEVLSLIGPNGAGKTTLLQNVCHLHKRFEGEILFRGKVIGKDYAVSDYRRRVAMVFQEPLLFDTTVFKNIASGLKFRGVDKKDIARRVTENLERFGISHLADRSARTLSGGRRNEQVSPEPLPQNRKSFSLMSRLHPLIPRLGMVWLKIWSVF